MTSPRSSTPCKPVAKKAPVKKAAAKRTPRRPKPAVAVLPGLPETPEPLRPLGQEGLRLWARVWALRSKWIDRELDLDHVTVLCESVDERVALRVRVLRDGEWRDRVALRALDEQVDRMMGMLGMNPSERARMNVAAETPDDANPLARMRNRYAQGRAEA